MRAEMSRNGVETSEPFLTMRTRPPCSTTKMRFEPSPAFVMPTGEVNPPIGDPSPSAGRSDDCARAGELKVESVRQQARAATASAAKTTRRYILPSPSLYEWLIKF